MTAVPVDIQVLQNCMIFPKYRLADLGSSLGGIFEGDRKNTLQQHSLEGAVSRDGRVYVDNILDTSLEKFQRHYEDEEITKDDIFYYVYGILHHDGYRQKYKNDLTKEIPRIPFAPDFRTFSDIGRKLGDIHCDYDKLKGWPDLKVEYSDEFEDDDPEHWQITNAKFEGEEKQTLHLNQHISIHKIPPTAYGYKIANRAPIEQFAAEIKKKTYEHSKIENDRNRLFAHNPPDVLLRARQLIEVGIRTTELLLQLPEEFE